MLTHDEAAEERACMDGVRLWFVGIPHPLLHALPFGGFSPHSAIGPTNEKPRGVSSPLRLQSHEVREILSRPWGVMHGGAEPRA
jgi:hypothetical protein